MPSEFDALLRDAVQTPGYSRPWLQHGSTLVGGRFVVERELGQGGMGVVYEVLDMTTGTRVALKALGDVDAENLYRLKNEFRAHADLCHPNVVRLHELFHDDGEWFFTMELVDGVPFLEHVCELSSVAFEETLASKTDLGDESGVSPSGRARGLWRFDEPSLRRALRRLARGISAIHGAGKLHLDLKPSNVLVSDSGHVTILDFGLARDRYATDETRAADRGVQGTPTYMSPEQAAYGALSEASDWYAFGVMLYEALVGRAPFEGTVQGVLRDKRDSDAPPPSEWADGLPADLEELCAALLSRDPSRRPSGDEILRRLGADRESTVPPRMEESFVGRREELDALYAGLGRTLDGEAGVVLLDGAPGVGKTTLAHRFLAEVRGSQRALVLEGRCGARESVPFKALDAVVDALARHLGRMADIDAATLLPRGIRALARSFPVLDRVRAVARAKACRSGRGATNGELGEATRALKDLLLRLSDVGPVVLFIDDLHFGDDESIALLREIFSAEDAPPVLLLGAYRSEGPECGLVRFLAKDDGLRASTRVEVIRVAPLTAANEIEESGPRATSRPPADAVATVRLALPRKVCA